MHKCECVLLKEKYMSESKCLTLNKSVDNITIIGDERHQESLD